MVGFCTEPLDLGLRLQLHFGRVVAPVSPYPPPFVFEIGRPQSNLNTKPLKGDALELSDASRSLGPATRDHYSGAPQIRFA